MSLVGAGILVTAWLLFGILTAMLECIPVKKAWLPLLPGHCLDSYKYLVIFQTGHIIIDMLILILPLPVVWGLHTGQSRKAILTGTLFCGYW